jgi:uncharacterized protein (DUF433 family)
MTAPAMYAEIPYRGYRVGGASVARYPLNLPAELQQEAARLAQQQGVSLNQFILWSVAEKVGELRRGLDDPAFPHITYRRGAAGYLTPIIRGTGIRVQTIVIAARNWGLAPREIARDYDLTEQQVKECLAFYEARPTEIDENIRAEEAIAASHA